ncbi:helix-turn-helix domain-containing protein [Catenulispora sp. NL8]|uniref:Helix-turn-helix domain-containing protein n=1 Tax=Catenulispora pinistramenti TaxID=2705254 RepID=A0ABS5KHQ3_9ACTN|nr:helix-turn-helix domain-containing protein [Catenulispora pinistramenti]MBS2545898.1 helix-turn-helix domain-containing protein [Catenulispora pinistramenti]
MKAHLRASLGRVIEDLGSTLLEVVCGDAVSEARVGGVVIYDPLEEQVSCLDALVLGVGVREPASIAALLSDPVMAGAAALVVRAPVLADPVVTAASSRSGVTVLALTPGATWAQLAAMVRSLIAEGDIAEVGTPTMFGTPAGDLFALANAIAALLDAPITIEDRGNRVLAFSGRQDEADASRVATILGRQVPEQYTRILEERGVYQALYRSEEPVFVDPLPDLIGHGEMPRAALVVRAGDEILGTIWAAVWAPLSAERAQALRDAAKLVALHMMRLRAGADVGRRLHADLVATALESGPGAAQAVARLGLAERAAVVVALDVIGSIGSDGEPSAVQRAHLVAERQRVADAFAVHLTAVHPRSAVAVVGDVVYAIVPVPQQSADGAQRVATVAQEFLRRVGTRHGLIVGIGEVGTGHGELFRSRAGAHRALNVLRNRDGEACVASISDVQLQALLAEMAETIAERGDALGGPVARLAHYDSVHRTGLVATLRAWLEAFGDVNAASATQYVHPNTFRYRLRRVAEIGQIDLRDADARFAAMLHLRLQPPGRPTAQGDPDADPAR